MSNRHDFTAQTKETLAKRVRYVCSNPICSKSTIGPHSEKFKSTLVGVAAHITAASPGGPRFDNSLREEQRRSIDNGIWLCVNCSTIIDKDELNYPKILLEKWKTDAEQKSLSELIGEQKMQPNAINPFLEADMIWTTGGRTLYGYADDNFIPGEKRLIIAGHDYLMNYELEWSYNFIIVNNSSVPAYNVSVERIEGYSRINFGKLNKTNNIPPFQSIEMKLKLEQYFTGYHFEADNLLTMDIPTILQNVRFKIKYLDDDRKEYFTIVDFKEGVLRNTRGAK
jgi:hypothetical protein